MVIGVEWGEYCWRIAGMENKCSSMITVAREECRGRNLMESEALLWQAVKEKAGQRWGMPLEAVLAVPGYFSCQRRQALKNAAGQAGLSLIRVAGRPAFDAFFVACAKRDARRMLLCYQKDNCLEVTAAEAEEQVVEILASDSKPIGYSPREQALGMIRNVLEAAELPINGLDQIFVNGRTAKIPEFVPWLKRMSGRPVFQMGNEEANTSLGALLLGSELQKYIHLDRLLLDVASHTLSVETQGGLCVPLIEKNRTLPCKASLTVTTVSGQQDRAEIHILQGEGQYARENESAGYILLEGVRPASGSPVRIELCAEISAGGEILVSAQALGTQQKESVTAGLLAPVWYIQDGIRLLSKEEQEQKAAPRSCRFCGSQAEPWQVFCTCCGHRL